MPIMFCQYNMFDAESQVYIFQEGTESYSIFKGNFEEISDFMCAEYQTGQYEKIVLAGPYAESIEQRIKTYSKSRYNKEDIKIEVI